MMTENEAEKIALWVALPFFFGTAWFSAGVRLALDFGELRWTPPK